MTDEKMIEIPERLAQRLIEVLVRELEEKRIC